MSERPRPLRLFVGAYPPPEVVERLHAALPRDELPAHRLVPAEQVHLTLQFIGDCPPGRSLDDVVESVRRSASGLAAFRLTPRRLITLPTRGPVRLVAAETDAPPPLLELKRRLVTRLAQPGAKERRGFRPHLTLLRFARPARAERLDCVLADETLSFEVDRVVLVRSTLHAGGARHAHLHEVTLGRRYG